MSSYQPPVPDNVIQRFGNEVVVCEQEVVKVRPWRGRKQKWGLLRPSEYADPPNDLPWYTRRRYWVDTPHHHFHFSSKRAKGKALCWGSIVHKTGFTEMEESEGMIPINVATLGKPYIAAYLYAVHDFRKEEIAEKLDVASSTVSVYLSDVGAGRR